MYRHLVFATLQPGADPATVDELLAAVRNLPQTIPYLRHASAGLDPNPRGPYNLALCFDFDHESDRRRYVSEPTHPALIPLLNATCQPDRPTLDYTF
jgi:hypothetical protein